MYRFALSIALVLTLAACGEDDTGRDNPMFTSGNADNEGDGDGDGEAEEAEAEAEGDGDDPTGDGDGDDPTGDGDGDDPTGDGDGDPTTGDGDGDPTGGGSCGDDSKEGEEECDGNDLGGLDCTDFGFEDGTLVCADDCTLFTNACSTCGDSQIEGTEVCDGSNFDGLTCADLGYASGNLSCSNDCHSVIESGCNAAPTCGNGVIDNGEACDGGNLGGSTCVSLGFDAGSLSCTAGCQFNTGNCTVEQCGQIFTSCNLIIPNCCAGLTCVPVFGCLPE